MRPSETTKRLLAFWSGDRCAFPGCPKNLTVEGVGDTDPAITGEAAHIAGEKPGSARYDPRMTDDERSRYDNLIYLCGDHHVQVDKQQAAFPCEKLLKMKRDHEARAREGMNAAFASIGFTELAHAVKWVLRIKPAELTKDYGVISPEEKIRRNEMTNRSRLSIRMGLGVAKEVRAFVESEARVDADFPERLRAGFLEEYYKQRRSGARGDDLFDLMCAFSQQGLKSQAERSAALAILVYLFEACEVFEK